ncbi:MAG: GumC family protein [Deferribacteres bacterium]|nr:GumC family protein [candidate division KSB1 bacterium]MCB9504282.1 GumC family protein [Deferribacteres bacterium]
MTVNKPQNGTSVIATAPSLQKFLVVLMKQKKLVAGIFLTTFITVALFTFLQTPLYRASAKVLMEPEKLSDSMVMFRLSPSRERNELNWLNSEISILQSRPIAARIVQQFNLLEPEENGNKLSDEDKQKQLESAIDDVQENLILESGQNSNIISISYDYKDPHIAAQIVNGIIDEYLKYRLEVFDNSGNYKFYEKQLQIVEEKLRSLEEKEAHYKQDQNIFSTQEQAEVLKVKLTDYERSLAAVSTALIGKRAKLRIVEEQLENNANINIPSTEVSDSPSRERYITTLKSQLLEMEIEKETLLQRFRPTYEKVVELTEQINITRKKIRSEIHEIIEQERASIRALEAEKQSLEKLIAGLRGDVQALAQKEYEIKQINRGIEDNRDLYSILLKQREEARISLEKLNSGVNVRIINPAFPSHIPVWPKKELNLILGSLFGLIFGLIVAFMVDYFDDTVSTIHELYHAADLKVLGSIEEKQRGLL